MFALLAWLGLGAAPIASPVAQQSVTLQRLALAVLIAAVVGGLVFLGPKWGRACVRGAAPHPHPRRYYTKTIDPSITLADSPVLLARDTNLEPIQNELSHYTCQNYKLNAWFPEDYKAFTFTDTPGFNIGTHR